MTVKEQIHIYNFLKSKTNITYFFGSVSIQ